MTTDQAAMPGPGADAQFARGGDRLASFAQPSAAAEADGASRSHQMRRMFTTMLSPSGTFSTLVLFAFLMDVRRIVARAIIDTGGQSVLNIVDNLEYLTLAEWFFILALVFKTDFSAIKPPGAVERALWLAVAVYTLLFVAAHSHNLPIVFCLAIAVRLALTRQLWALSACLALVALQWAPHKSALAWLNDICNLIDAWAAHAILSALGFAVYLQGPVLRLHGSAHAISIFRGCNSLIALAPIVCAFGIIVLVAGVRLDLKLLPRLLSLVAMVIAMNWIRLSLMTLSYDHYLFWHSGPGASIVAAAYALLAFLMAKAASGDMNFPCPRV